MSSTRSVEVPVRPTVRRGDIQGLRAVAVLLVVLSHMGVAAFAGGYLGVDVFFVVSGFLITGLLVHEARTMRNISLIGFYARRARRILPAATVVLLATIAATYVLLGSIRASETARDAVWASLFAINWKFSIQGTDYFATTLPPSPLQHYWSLSVEEQFYLVWPALLLLILFVGAAFDPYRRTHMRRAARSRWIKLVAVLAVLTVASLAWSFVSTRSAPAAAYFSSFTRIWELGAGALLALGIGRFRRLSPGLAAGMSWLGLIGIVVASVLYDEATPFPGIAALLPVAATVLVIAGGTTPTTNGAHRLLGLRPFQWIGDRSYSLYLWHWPVLIIAAAYLGKDPTLLQATGLMLGALVLTMLTYTLVERPIHHGASFTANERNSLLLWPTSFAVVATVVLVSLALVRTPEVSIAVADSGFATAGPIATSTAAAPTTADDSGAAATTTAAPATTTAGVEAGVVAAVQAAADAAHAQDPVPSTLAPPLTTARDDAWETAAPDTCIPTFNDTTSDVCHFGPDDSANTMVIVGDSHSGQFLPALHVIADATGWKVTYLIKGGCTAADVVAWRPLDGEGRQDSCTEWRTWALGQIQDMAPDLVIVSDRGTKSLNGPGDAEIAQETPEHMATWQAGMVSTIQTLQGYGSKVAVISETAEGDADPVSCLSRPSADLGSCAYDLTDSVKQINEANTAATAATGATYVDAIPWMCDDGYCPIVVAGMITQSDTQHFSVTYSTALAGTLQAALPLT